MEAAGLPIYQHIEKLHHSLNLPEFKIKNIVGQFIDDIDAVLPKDKLLNLYYDKMENSPDFKEMMEKLSSDEFRLLLGNLVTNDIFESNVKDLSYQGVDINTLKMLYYFTTLYEGSFDLLKNKLKQ